MSLFVASMVSAPGLIDNIDDAPHAILSDLLAQTCVLLDEQDTLAAAFNVLRVRYSKNPRAVAFLDIEIAAQRDARQFLDGRIKRITNAISELDANGGALEAC